MKKTNKIIKFILSLSITISATVTGITVMANEEVRENEYQEEMINPIYDENGELIEFTVSLENTDPALLEILQSEVENRDINLMNSTMNDNGMVPLANPKKGIWKWVGGLCAVIEFLTGYSCLSIARFLMLELVNGYWMSKGKRYTATWQVTLGYIPGCQPMHSGTCYRATYTKLA